MAKSIHQMRLELERISRDRDLRQVEALEPRLEALDRVALIAETLQLAYGPKAPQDLLHKAAELRAELEFLNQQLYHRYREGIRSGHLPPTALRRQLDRYTDYSPAQHGAPHLQPEALDTLVRGILFPDPPPAETRERHPEMVGYQASPVRAVLDLVDHAGIGPEDLFYDLGSGYGLVPMLVNLLSGIKTVGVEFEPAYVDYARRSAAELGLGKVRFLLADARQADLSAGTIFYMFTPFCGAILDQVLVRLAQEALGRTIKLCSFGTTSLEIGTQSWLKCVLPDEPHQFKLAVFESQDPEETQEPMT